MVFDQLADTRRTVDMWNDLEQKTGCQQRGFDRTQIGLFVFVPHRADGNLQPAIVQRADQRVDFRLEGRFSELLGKTPEFSAAGDGRMVVEKHAVSVAALAAPKRDRDNLPALR